MDARTPLVVAAPCSIEVSVVTASVLRGGEVREVGGCARLVDWPAGSGGGAPTGRGVSVVEVCARAVVDVFALDAAAGRAPAGGVVGVVGECVEAFERAWDD